MLEDQQRQGNLCCKGSKLVKKKDTILCLIFLFGQFQMSVSLQTHCLFFLVTGELWVTCCWLLLLGFVWHSNIGLRNGRTHSLRNGRTQVLAGYNFCSGFLSSSWWCPVLIHDPPSHTPCSGNQNLSLSFSKAPDVPLSILWHLSFCSECCFPLLLSVSYSFFLNF